MPPEIDPMTGQQQQQQSGAPESVQISKEEWDGLKTRLDSFERMGGGQQFQQPAQSAAAPSGPSLDDQLAAFDTKISAFDARIDEAVKNGDPVSALLRERDKLNSQRIRVEIKHRDLDPALNAGIGVIDQISAEMSRGKMKYYDIVKADVDQVLAGLPADQRMNPQVRESAYQFAVGKNVDKIMNAQREEILRSAATDSSLASGGANGRNGASSNPNIPNPKDILGKEAMQALKSKGITADDHYRKMGYAGGWEEFWEKRGKDYFGDQD